MSALLLNRICCLFGVLVIFLGAGHPVHRASLLLFAGPGLCATTGPPSRPEKRLFSDCLRGVLKKTRHFSLIGGTAPKRSRKTHLLPLSFPHALLFVEIGSNF
jgi:hypothetical protein